MSETGIKSVKQDGGTCLFYYNRFLSKCLLTFIAYRVHRLYRGKTVVLIIFCASGIIIAGLIMG